MRFISFFLIEYQQITCYCQEMRVTRRNLSVSRVVIVSIVDSLEKLPGICYITTPQHFLEVSKHVTL